MHVLNQVMRERNHSNVKFVNTAVLKSGNWMDMFHQFMKERNHSNVTFVTTAVHDNIP